MYHLDLFFNRVIMKINTTIWIRI